MSTLLNFVRMFVRAREENCKQIEYEKKKAEKEAENEKLKLAAKKESENMIRSTINSGNINWSEAFFFKAWSYQKAVPQW